MADASSYPVYQAYVENVRDFIAAETEIRRGINRALKCGKLHTVRIQTKIYALLYSTFAEANFSKLVLTPYGFQQSFIEQILHEDKNLQEKWLGCLDLAFQKFNVSKKASEIPNKKQELKRIIQEFIIDPSIIRNKIAHGQFSVALNRKGKDKNSDITNQINNLDIVSITRLFKINQLLVDILEDLIESPDYAHHANYYSKFQSLMAFIEKSANWTIASKMAYGNMRRMAKTRHSNP